MTIKIVSKGGIWKMPNAAVMPMNSVTSVSQFTENQINQGKPAPERTKGAENRLGMPMFGHRSQPNCHLLNIISDRKQEYQEPNKSISVSGACHGIGGDPSCVIIRQHDNNPWTADDKKQMN